MHSNLGSCHTRISQPEKSLYMCRQSSAMGGGSLYGAFVSFGSRRSNAQRRASHIVRADVDYYNVLGVDKNADKKSIKQAYRCVLQRVLCVRYLLILTIPSHFSSPTLAVAAVYKHCGRKLCLYAYRHDLQAMLLQAEGPEIPSRCK